MDYHQTNHVQIKISLMLSEFTAPSCPIIKSMPGPRSLNMHIKDNKESHAQTMLLLCNFSFTGSPNKKPFVNTWSTYCICLSNNYRLEQRVRLVLQKQDNLIINYLRLSFNFPSRSITNKTIQKALNCFIASACLIIIDWTERLTLYYKRICVINYMQFSINFPIKSISNKIS